MIDIRIDNNEGHFKFRVSGTVCHKDKYLFVQMNDNPFYCLPGGHVELGENTEDAILREMEEELGFPVKILRFVGIAQNFFEGKDKKPFHELAFYYVVEAQNENDLTLNDYFRLENDKGFMQRLNFKWMTLEEATNVDFRPSFILDMLKSEKEQHLIFDYRKN